MTVSLYRLQTQAVSYLLGHLTSFQIEKCHSLRKGIFAYTDSETFVSLAHRDIKTIAATDSGCCLLDRIGSLSIDVFIVPYHIDGSVLFGKGHPACIGWSASDRLDFGKYSQLTESPSYTTLMHEYLHALRGSIKPYISSDALSSDPLVWGNDDEFETINGDPLGLFGLSTLSENTFRVECGLMPRYSYFSLDSLPDNLEKLRLARIHLFSTISDAPLAKIPHKKYLGEESECFLFLRGKKHGIVIIKPSLELSLQLDKVMENACYFPLNQHSKLVRELIHKHFPEMLEDTFFQCMCLRLSAHEVSLLPST